MPVVQAIPRFVQLMLEVHRADPRLHRVFAEQLPLVSFPLLEASLKEAVALTRAYLQAHADELVVEDLDAAAFMVVHVADSITHAAVITRPELLQAPALEGELVRCLLRYLSRS